MSSLADSAAEAEGFINGEFYLYLTSLFTKKISIMWMFLPQTFCVNERESYHIQCVPKIRPLSNCWEKHAVRATDVFVKTCMKTNG